MNMFATFDGISYVINNCLTAILCSKLCKFQPSCDEFMTLSTLGRMKHEKCPLYPGKHIWLDCALTSLNTVFHIGN